MTPYDPSSLSTVGRWLAQSPVGPFETSDAKGLARISACIRATSSTRNCSGRYMGYPRIGLCKRNSLDAGKTRIFVPALTSTERIWRHTRHVRFGSKADIAFRSASYPLCPRKRTFRRLVGMIDRGVSEVLKFAGHHHETSPQTIFASDDGRCRFASRFA